LAASLKEIAQASGVSVATAARFLNGEQKEVWASTARRAQRVRDIAKQMGYRPNHRAKSLARKRSMAIGMLYGRQGIFLADNYHRVISNLGEQLAHKGYDMMMIPAVGPASQWSAKLMDGRVDACIVCDPAPDDLQNVLEKIDIPMIGINLSTDANIPMIRYNEAQGAQLVMDHLLELGHKRFWLAAYDMPKYKSLEHVSFITRLQTIKDNLKAHGYLDMFRYETCIVTQQIKMIEALPAEQRPTAIIAQNDTRAMEVIKGLTQVDIKVPDEISVVGFNDDKSSEHYIPAITTISLPVYKASDKAVSYLLSYLNDKDCPESHENVMEVMFDERLVVRQSTCKACS
jgi:LacI family transcriptional regulator